MNPEGERSQAYLEQTRPQPPQPYQRSPSIRVNPITLIFIIFIVLNLPFIITNLVYVYQKSDCISQPIQGISFNMSQWLQIDSTMKILLGIFLPCLFLCPSKSGMETCAGLLFLFVSFIFIWNIVGCVAFWGRLNPTGKCQGSIQAYMFAVLIINYLPAILNCAFIMVVVGKADKQ